MAFNQARCGDKRGQKNSVASRMHGSDEGDGPPGFALVCTVALPRAWSSTTRPRMHVRQRAPHMHTRPSLGSLGRASHMSRPDSRPRGSSGRQDARKGTCNVVWAWHGLRGSTYRLSIHRSDLPTSLPVSVMRVVASHQRNRRGDWVLSLSDARSVKMA